MTDREIEAFYRKLGSNIKAVRQNNKLNQSALAQALNLSRASVVNLEKGRQRPPLHLVYEICAKFQCKYHDLIPGDVNENNNAEDKRNKSELEELDKFPKEDQEKIKSFLKNLDK